MVSVETAHIRIIVSQIIHEVQAAIYFRFGSA